MEKKEEEEEENKNKKKKKKKKGGRLMNLSVSFLKIIPLINTS